ncbi:zinc finger MYM-type protein 1-like [Gordionus sp. m RMFG-2023]|uniref:zinc finger MYM-type protein 1-like n=1 Tax=Gordionus sp. m RMFG-2023 TaxID=3053472 RepID=UPI0031FE29D0
MDICKFFRQQQKEKDIDVALASKNQPSVELVFVVSSDDEERPDIPLPLHGKTNDELATKSSGKSSNDETPHRSQKDVSLYLNFHFKNDNEKLLAVENIWIPDKCYKFPLPLGKRNLTFQASWLNKYKWLAYSADEKGAFCKVCVIFSPRYAGNGLQKLKTLVSQVYTRWKDALENFNYHQKNKYHLNSCEIMDSLKEISMNQKISISNVLNKKNFDIVTKNRSRIIIIIDVIIWLGRQAWRNFKELLKFLCNNNDNYLKLFESSSKNATYLSPTIQNEIISICNQFILKEVSSKVKASPFFSVLADETSDIGNIEQLSIAIRFIDMESGNYKMKELFVQFIELPDTKSETIANQIIKSLQNLDLNLNLLRGQGYDGAPSMSGHVKGVQSRIRELYSTALYVHCSSHCLNLMITEACEIRDIRNSLRKKILI